MLRLLENSVTLVWPSFTPSTILFTPKARAAFPNTPTNCLPPDNSPLAPPPASLAAFAAFANSGKTLFSPGICLVNSAILSKNETDLSILCNSVLRFFVASTCACIDITASPCNSTIPFNLSLSFPVAAAALRFNLLCVDLSLTISFSASATISVTFLDALLSLRSSAVTPLSLSANFTDLSNEEVTPFAALPVSFAYSFEDSLINLDISFKLSNIA